MPIDKLFSTKTPEYTSNEKVFARKIDSGPHIAIVKNNIDPARMGRLEVWIPILSGIPEATTYENIKNSPEAQKTFYTVSYAPPYYGTTLNQPEEKQNSFGTTKHSYGMWFTPPDIGVKVLVVFANGDPNKGFWIACIPDNHNHYMVPSMGADKSGSPVVEFNDNNVGAYDEDWYNKNSRPTHTEQAKILSNQGLDGDTIRGPLFSSSQRESPSQVFGISTPGRKTSSGSKFVRKGGHTFVMDDGDLNGGNQFYRLRTAGGHQIIMHDSSDFIYISNKSGSAWVELNGSGDVEIFSAGSINMRAKKDINLHADNDFNLYVKNQMKIVAEKGTDFESKYLRTTTSEETKIYAQQNLELKSGQLVVVDGSAVKIQGTSELSIQGGFTRINSGGTQSVTPPDPIKRKTLNDAVGGPPWSSGGTMKTIVPRAPTHEPDPNHKAVASGGGGSASSGSSSTVVTSSGSPIQIASGGTLTAPGASSSNTTKTDKTDEMKKIPSKDRLPKNLETYLKEQPNQLKGITGKNGVTGLSEDELRSYKAVVGARESGGSGGYQADNKLGFIGKYQIGAAALVDQGYISKDYYSRYGDKAVYHDAAWSGPAATTSGITSKESFLNSPAAQETIMDRYTQTNYDRMVRTGSLRQGDTGETVSGYLASAHLLGSGGPVRDGSGNVVGGTGAYGVRFGTAPGARGTDAFGTTGAEYYNVGRRAYALSRGSIS